MSWDKRHLIDVEGFSAEDLDLVLRQAAEFRARIDAGESSVDVLRGKSVALFFSEASTRTRLSFELAARKLGADTLMLDPGSSSVTKGETFVDTVRNLDAIGFDYLVMRHHRSGAADVAARHFGGHVVNGGDGWQGHPTQALLDLLTMIRAFGGDAGGASGGRLADAVRGRKIVIVGDILHSRVARSNAFTLSLAGADVWFAAPRAWLRSVPGAALTTSSDFSEALRGADAVMALRVQKERMAPGVSLAAYIDGYQVTEERLAQLAPDALFMHPGPINEGIEVTHEVALGPRSLVMEQARNGVPVRMSVLALLVGNGGGAGQAIPATGDLANSLR